MAHRAHSSALAAGLGAPGKRNDKGAHAGVTHKARVSPASGLSATEDDGVRDLVALLTSPDEVQVTLLFVAELSVTVDFARICTDRNAPASSSLPGA